VRAIEERDREFTQVEVQKKEALSQKKGKQKGKVAAKMKTGGLQEEKKGRRYADVNRGRGNDICEGGEGGSGPAVQLHNSKVRIITRSLKSTDEKMAVGC